MQPRKCQHEFSFLLLRFFRLGQTSPILGKGASQYPRYVEERRTAANQAPVMRAITNNVAFGTQDRILQRYSIQRLNAKGDIVRILSLHHRTSYSLALIVQN